MTIWLRLWVTLNTLTILSLGELHGVGSGAGYQQL